MKKMMIYFFSLVMALSLLGCQKTDPEKNSAKELPSYTVDAQTDVLTIAGTGAEMTVYTADELRELGTVTLSYSGRNKQVENARQFFEFTGVELNRLLEKSGFETEDVDLKIVCSDGYTREYSLEDLYEGYAFQNNEDNEKEAVVPMIAILDVSEDAAYPSPFKLICGQEDWDCREAQDFNMQNWATYIQYIEVNKH